MSSRKSEILHFDGLFLGKSCKVSAKKDTKGLSLMTLKSDGKFKEKQTGGFKCYMKNLVNYHSALQKSFFFLMGSFWPKYKGFDLQKQRSFFFHGTKQWHKIEINPDLVASKMVWEIGEISLEHSNVWKIVLWLAPFVQSIQSFRRKSTEVLYLMTLNSDAKYEEKLTLGFKNHMGNSANFKVSSSKSENLHFDVLLFLKV